MNEQTGEILDNNMGDTSAPLNQNQGVAGQLPGENPTSPVGEGESPTENPEVTGLKSAVQAERERRQEAEQEREYFKQLAQQQTQPKQDDLFSGMEDDDILTVGQFKKQEQKLQEELDQRLQTQNIQMSAERAKAKYSDYDNALDYFNKYATPIQKQIVVASSDPAEEAYRFGSTRPEYQAQQQQQTATQAAKQTVDTINQHVNQAQTLSNTGGGGRSPLDEVSRIAALEGDKLEAEIQKVKAGKK